MKTLLITTVGGQVGLGILKVLEPLRDRIRVVGVNSVAESVQNYHCDTAYLVPPTADLPAWTRRMMEVLTTERPDAVIAGRDEDMTPLAALKSDRDLAGIGFFCPGPRTAAIVTDKRLSAEFAQAHGLAFVDTAWDAAGVARLVATHGFPLIVKPQSGSGSAGVRVLTRPSEVEAWLKRDGVVFQPFIAPPQDLGADAVDPTLGIPLGFSAPWQIYLNPTASVDLDGKALYRGTTYLAPRGKLSQSWRVEDPAYERLTMDYARALASLDFVGSFSLQARTDRDGRLIPFEICGRVAGGVYPRILVGVSELAVILDYLLPGLPAGVTTAAAASRIVHKQQDWDWLDVGAIDRLRNHGVWRKETG